MSSSLANMSVPHPSQLSEYLLPHMPEMQLPEGVPAEAARPASVMMLLVGNPQAPELVLTLRSAHLKSHAGQVSFPGGKPDAGDQTLLDTALRECEEEIGWPAKNIEVLGFLPLHLTGTGYLIQPVVGYSQEPPGLFLEKLKIQNDEVASVWTEPLLPYLDEARYVPKSRDWNGRTRHYHVIDKTEPVIWGATASIMLSFARRLHQKSDDLDDATPISC